VRFLREAVRLLFFIAFFVNFSREIIFFKKFEILLIAIL